MKIEKVKSKLKKAFNRVMGVLLPVATLLVSCGTNALVVHAAESKNYISFQVYEACEYDQSIYNYDLTDTYKITVQEGYEIVGVIQELGGSGNVKRITISAVKNGKVDNTYLGNYSVYRVSNDRNGKHESTISVNPPYSDIPYSGYGVNSIVASSFTMLAGEMKIFADQDEFRKYLSNGGGDYDIIKPDELEKGWYLKNVSYKVTADDSPSSEAGADATYIHFSWDTDNLQEGDLLEIKTKSYYKKILGEQLSGFHDFITKSDGVSAYEGKYSFSQYEATKAWFNSLENKPLVFKEYDTTDYYLRPYRQGQYGGWVHIKMGRSTPTSSPYIEDIEYGDFDDDNNWTVDEDLTDKNGGHHGVDQGGGYIPPDQSDNPFTGTNIAGIFSYFYDFMKQIPAMLGDLPALVGNIISFLPKPIIAFIGIGVIVAIILRIVGR